LLKLWFFETSERPIARPFSPFFFLSFFKRLGFLLCCVVLTLQSSCPVGVRFAGSLTGLLYIALRQRASERTDQNELFVAAKFPIPRKLIFYLAPTRTIHGQLYLPCVVLGLGETDRKQQEKLNSRPLGDKKGRKRENKRIFSPREKT